MKPLTIKPLGWDSKHLGITCGRLSFDQTTPASTQQITPNKISTLFKKSEAKLIVSKVPSTHNNLVNSLKSESIFIDAEITFQYSHADFSPNCPDNYDVIFYKSCDPTPFKSLAQEMKYSRYYLDPNISDRTAESMWIDSIKNHCLTLADEIATLHINNEPAGIITIQKRANRVINLHIVGILKKFQNRAAGRHLIQQVIQRFHKNHTILVEASSCNRRALKFYQHNGFFLESIQYIMHYWQQET